MRPRLLIALLAIAALTAALGAGCGGGGSTSGNPPTDSGETSASGGSQGARLTKAQFIKKADAICERIDEEQLAGLRQAADEDPSILKNERRNAEAAIEVAMPLIRQQAAEIEELGPPPGDEQQVRAIADAMTEAAEGVEREIPESIIGEFREVDRLSKRYGFKACSEAL